MQGVSFSLNDANGWDFRGQDLSRATLYIDTPSGADFSNASLVGANLRNTDLTGANITDTDLAMADLRGAIGFSPEPSTVTRNTIWPVSPAEGEIRGLHLLPGDILRIDDFFGIEANDVHVKNEFVVADGGVLEIVESDMFPTPRLILDKGVTPRLGGTFRLLSGPPRRTFAQGATIDLFDWPGPLEPGNEFSVVELPAGTLWDLSDLYVTGEITLNAFGSQGDFDVNGLLDAADLAILIRGMRDDRGWPPYDLDLNSDSRYVLDREDLRIWIKDLKHTWFGDADLDGKFDSSDMVASLRGSEYETGVYAGWAVRVIGTRMAFSIAAIWSRHSPTAGMKRGRGRMRRRCRSRAVLS